MKTLKLAVIGAGHLGRIHAKLISEMPDVELVGVADPLRSAREKVAADHGTTAFADHRELLGRVDGAVIATPTRHHHAVALDFLARSTPLLVEKPLAGNLAEAKELVEVAQRSGALLQVGHIERFNPAFLAAAPEVNEPKYVEAVRASGFTGRSTDIGVVYDLMIHDIDLLLTIVGSQVKAVSALGVAILGRHEDVAQARLEFENGCLANLSASRVSYGPTPKRQMQIWSAQGFAAIDFGNRSASVVRPSDRIVRRDFDFETLTAEEKAGFQERLFSEILRVEPLAVESRNALADELRDFVDSIRNACAPRVTGQDGRDAVAVAEMILQSICVHPWQGRGTGPMGPLAVPELPILRGPHWQSPVQRRPVRREAG
ncbi:MAG: Gfo/Idh/MocA family oxidoreductase [Planctomycetia bacterium]|nr:Gfo/Idh/MocA family oxidoreductase [Planctomycetia bacterium]